ncbi:gp53-like domain-containing protein [Rosenbergiella metrosideri]|uniref:gp53-like domain-containing protein n=1 Tax=Rosenbergiella metrosideri TaxID=2921185 RepID=UPI001F50379C|nr:hypothetical protein [Rosenbergiella metrosideri]
MAATGTIALNANSLTVTGSGTKFTTEAQVGGALVTYIGNVPYTFVVGAINSDTSIALTANYQGTNVSGQSFSLIDRSAYTAITAELGARTAQAIRGLNYDKANWQQILTGSGNVTVNVPDGSQYTGPSWLSLANSLASKANSADLGNSATKDVGTAANTVAAGNDSRITGAMPKTGGTFTGAANFSTLDLSKNFLQNVGITDLGNSALSVQTGGRAYRIVFSTSVITLNSSGEATVGYDKTFPTALVSVVAIPADNTGGTSLAIINFSTSRTTSFDVHVFGQSSGGFRLNYIAIGY